MPPLAAIQPRPEDAPILGRYRPVRPIGSGGSASVWLAIDEAAGREVALKIVPRAGKAADRAEREAGAVERLRHPHCARVYASARDGDHVYVVYEYVAGVTLREALRDRRLSDRDVVAVAAQLCDALAHAHARGIVHRDVKPTNVLLEEGDGITVKLLDFGLAQVDGEDTLTAEGDVPGTLAYISPERLDGLPTTGAADVWSIGLILWEGLAGRHPFFAVGSPVQTARRIADGPPPIADERPDLPQALLRAVARSLALDPYDRPRPAQLARMLRESIVPRRERRPRAATISRRRLAERLVHGAAAGAFTGTMLTLFPFFPAELTVPGAALVGLVAVLVPRLGLALALAAPVLPLADGSAGLAWAYAGLAAAWLGAFWRQPASALLVLAGVPLGLLGALVLLPLVALAARGWPARALIAGLGVATAVAWNGLHGQPLPLTGDSAPLGLGIDGVSEPLAVLHAIARFPLEHVALSLAALALGLAAALAPGAARRGLWGACCLGAALLASLVLPPLLVTGTDVSTLPVTVGAWLVAAALAAPALRALAGMRAKRPAGEPTDAPTVHAPLAAGRPASADTIEPTAEEEFEHSVVEDTDLWNALVGGRAASLD